MKYVLKLFSLFALAFSLNASAVEGVDASPEASPDPAAAKEHCKIKKMLKKFKAMQFRKALVTAGVDDATTEKIMNSMKDLGTEKKAKFKALKQHFKAEVMKHLSDAGLSKEKAEEVVANYKNEVKHLRKTIKSALKQFVHENMSQEPAVAPEEEPAK